MSIQDRNGLSDTKFDPNKRQATAVGDNSHLSNKPASPFGRCRPESPESKKGPMGRVALCPSIEPPRKPLTEFDSNQQRFLNMIEIYIKSIVKIKGFPFFRRSVKIFMSPHFYDKIPAA
jgi:hypothetical protein